MNLCGEKEATTDTTKAKPRVRILQNFISHYPGGQARGRKKIFELWPFQLQKKRERRRRLPDCLTVFYQYPVVFSSSDTKSVVVLHLALVKRKQGVKTKVTLLNYVQNVKAYASPFIKRRDNNISA